MADTVTSLIFSPEQLAGPDALAGALVSDEALAALDVSLTVAGEADEDLSAVLETYAQTTDRNAKAKLLT